MGSSQIKWRLDITTFRSVHFCKVHTKLQRQQRQVQSPLPIPSPFSLFIPPLVLRPCNFCSHKHNNFQCALNCSGKRVAAGYQLERGRCCWQALSLVYWSQTGSASHTHTNLYTHAEALRGVWGQAEEGGGGVCVLHTFGNMCVQLREYLKQKMRPWPAATK